MTSASSRFLDLFRTQYLANYDEGLTCTINTPHWGYQPQNMLPVGHTYTFQLNSQQKVVASLKETIRTVSGRLTHTVSLDETHVQVGYPNLYNATETDALTRTITWEPDFNPENGQIMFNTIVHINGTTSGYQLLTLPDALNVGISIPVLPTPPVVDPAQALFKALVEKFKQSGDGNEFQWEMNSPSRTADIFETRHLHLSTDGVITFRLQSESHFHNYKVKFFTREVKLYAIFNAIGQFECRVDHSIIKLDEKTKSATGGMPPDSTTLYTNVAEAMGKCA